MHSRISNKTFAEVHFVIGPFDKIEVIEVADRDKFGVEAVKLKYGNELYGYRFFDRQYVELDGVSYESEPINYSEKVLTERQRLDIIAHQDMIKSQNHRPKSWAIRLYDLLLPRRVGQR
jgi:hypothetical protein